MENADRPINAIVQEEYIAGNRVLQCTQAGLTKREYFAGLAMQGLLTTVKPTSTETVLQIPSNIAKWSVMCADELLKALETENPQP